MYVKFFSREFNIRDTSGNEHLPAEINFSKVLKMEFIEEHNGEVVYKVMLEGGIELLVFGDEILGGH